MQSLLNKRVLIIGYYFVDTNMGGVRLRRISRLLPRYGWDPVVLTHPRSEGFWPAEKNDPQTEEIASFDLTRAYERLRKVGRPSKPAFAPAAAAPVAKKIGFTSG